MSAHHHTPASTALSDEYAQLEKIRQQILSDMEALRLQEQNLRTYENRLRAVSSAGSLSSPASLGQQELDAEREKLSRLRALLEAERRAVVDERLVLREERAALTRKADELRQREAWLDLREREAKAKAFEVPPAAKRSGSLAPFGLRLGLNEVPFAEYFRSQRRSA